MLKSLKTGSFRSSLTVEKSSHCVRFTSVPIFSSIWTFSSFPSSRYDGTDPAHALVKNQSNRLNRDIPLLASLTGPLAESPQDTSGDEAAAANGDEEVGCWVLEPASTLIDSEMNVRVFSTRKVQLIATGRSYTSNGQKTPLR